MARRLSSTALFDALYSPEVHRIALIAGLGAAALIAGFYGYRWHVGRADERAQRFFSESYKEYAQALASDNPSWVTVEGAFKAGYKQAGSSSLAPYFLAFEADALAQQDKMQEAIAVLDKGLNAMGTRSPLYPLFAIKKAAMQLDAGDSALVSTAIENLKKLADDKQNIYRDMALYYLSSFYKAMGDETKARELEKEMRAVTLEGDVSSLSPWSRG